MSFAETMAGVRACPGLVATAIADRDGIAVESWGGTRDEVEEAVAEYAALLREVGQANRELQIGTLDQLVMAGGQRVVLLTAITDDYFLMTVVERSGNPGKARFASRLAANRLRREFS